MKYISRRQWLRNSGFAGALTVLGGLPAMEASRNTEEYFSALSTPVRLNANENPYGPSKAVRETLSNAFDDANRYPFAYINELVEALAKKEGVTPDHIVVSGGSWEGLKITGLTYGLYNGEIIAAHPTYQSLLSYADQFGAHINRVPVDENMGHDLPEMGKRITENTKLVFICNPNNPTGNILKPDQLETFCERISKRTIVFSDEAYYDYIEEPSYPSMVSLVKQGMNVIVSRTFSKVYGLAGLRVGYMIARPDIAARLKPNVPAGTNVLAIKAALRALEDKEFRDFSLRKNREAKEYLYGFFDELGLSYIPSHTNFVFFRSGRDIHGLIDDMRKEGVYIGRPFPPKYDWCRISTGTMEEMRVFSDALRKVI